jgi:hypothetical protein
MCTRGASTDALMKTIVTPVARTSTRRSQRDDRLTLDAAIIAVLIGAMEANKHVSPDEAARAHNLIWSMRRFRRQSGETVGALIADVRDRMGRDGVDRVLERAGRSIPARLRPSVFASAVDLMLADTTLQREERRFLKRLAAWLRVPARTADEIARVLVLKNSV